MSSKPSHKKTGSKFQRYSVKAKLRFTKTKSSQEPKEIIEAKARLKATKNLTAQVEEIAQKLYLAQNEESRSLTKLCDQLTNTHIQDSDDKFAIFLNNMGRVQQNLEDIHQIYLINMLDQFIIPIKNFNKNEIRQCQAIKLKLKTIKGQYDLKKKHENKIIRAQSVKQVNLKKVHYARNKSTIKLDELQLIRNEFLESVQKMEAEKLALLVSIKQYMSSYAAYSNIYREHLELQNDEMNEMMSYVPPNINNAFGLDSDTEDLNDNNETMSKFKDWSKTITVIKQGYFKKQGKVNKSFKKRYFKLFVNRKLVYFTSHEHGAILKGHIDLSKNVMNIDKIDTESHYLIEIKTKIRLWTFQYDAIKDRDNWLNIFNEICPIDSYQDKHKEIEEQKHDIDDLLVSPQSPSHDPMEFVNILMTFKVILDRIEIFMDEELKEKTELISMKNGDMVQGQYINSDVILLEHKKGKFYISAMDIVEVPIDEQLEPLSLYV